MTITAYIDQDDLDLALTARRLGELLDDAGTWSEGEAYSANMTSALEYCILRACGVVDGYLRAKYTVPLTVSGLSDSSKSLIQQWAIEICVYYLKLRRRETITEGDFENYSKTLKQLSDVAKGVIKIDIGDSADGVTQHGELPTSGRLEADEGTTPIFGYDSTTDPLSKF